MKKRTAEEILKDIIPLLMINLEELSDVTDNPNQQFAYGEKLAYIECLEILSTWEKAALFGLNFNIQKKYPL